MVLAWLMGRASLTGARPACATVVYYGVEEFSVASAYPSSSVNRRRRRRRRRLLLLIGFGFFYLSSY
jgi:hypothetical protein